MLDTLAPRVNEAVMLGLHVAVTVAATLAVGLPLMEAVNDPLGVAVELVDAEAVALALPVDEAVTLVLALRETVAVVLAL